MKYIKDYKGIELTTGEIRKGDIIKFCGSEYEALGNMRNFEGFDEVFVKPINHNEEEGVMLFATEGLEEWFPCDVFECLNIDNYRSYADECGVKLELNEDGELVATLK